MTGETERTLRGLLLDEAGKDVVGAVVRALEEEGVARTAVSGGRRVSRSAWRFLSQEVGRVVGVALEQDVGDLMLGCWKKHQVLRKAAQATAAAPGRREVVDLAKHTLKAQQQPYVDLLLDETRLARVRLDLTVTVDVDCLSAVVQGGRLVELKIGDVTVTVALTVKGVCLPPKSRALDPDVLVRLPPGGLPLLRDLDVSVPQQRDAETEQSLDLPAGAERRSDLGSPAAP